MISTFANWSTPKKVHSSSMMKPRISSLPIPAKDAKRKDVVDVCLSLMYSISKVD